MGRLALIVGLFAGSVGFTLGHLNRAPAPPTPAAEPAPVAAPKPLATQRRTRLTVLDVAARRPGLHIGDHVDILSTIRNPDVNFETETVTLLQNVVVLDATPRDALSVRLSLMLLPEEAERLLLAERMGRVDVTLRNAADVDIQEERGRATAYTLFSGERARVLLHKRLGLP